VDENPTTPEALPSSIGKNRQASPRLSGERDPDVFVHVERGRYIPPPPTCLAARSVEEWLKRLTPDTLQVTRRYDSTLSASGPEAAV
jgi:uncharacterized protein YgbK (DUF1537 family)